MIKKCNNDAFSTKRSKNYIAKETYELIPYNAIFIFSLNTPAILKEIDFDKLHKTKEYIDKLRPFYPQNKPFTNVFANPEACGININKNLIFYIDAGKSKEEIYSATILPLYNSRYFKKMVEKELNEISIKKDNYNYLNIDDRSLVAWNNNFTFFMTSEPEFDKLKVLNTCFDKNSKKYFDKNSDFEKFIKKSNHDIYYWFDMDSYSKNQIFPIAQNRKPMDKKYLEDILYYGNIDFKTGEIDIDIYAKWNNYIKEHFSNIIDENIESNLLKNVPLDREISFFSTFSLNFLTIQKYIFSDVKSKLALRKSLSKYGLMIEDINNVFSGDLAFISFPNENSSKSSTLVVLKIKDEEKFYNLIKVGTDMKNLVKSDDNTYILPRPSIPFYPINVTYEDGKLRMVVKNDNIYISGDENIINFIKSGQEPSKNNNFNTIKSYVYVYGGNNFPKVDKYANKFNLESFEFSFNNSLKIKLIPLNKNKSSLKQILSIK